MSGFILNVVGGLLVAAILAIVGLVWRHREAVKYKLDDWYYNVYCLLFNPGKKGRDETAALNALVVGRIRMKHNPYTGEDDISKVTFKTDEARIRHRQNKDSLF